MKVLVNSIFRYITKHPLYSTVNITGLALSMAMSALIFFFIKQEVSFDAHHVNVNSIYRLESNFFFKKLPNPEMKVAFLSEPLIERIRQEVPGLQASTRFMKGYNKVVVTSGQEFFSETITYVDNDFFRMFSFPLLYGGNADPFRDQSSIVITNTVAKKHFGNDNPVGRTLRISDQGVSKEYSVTGVIQDPPATSSISFEILAPLESYEYYGDLQYQWNESNYGLYVQVAGDKTRESLESDLALISDRSKREIVRKDDSFKLTVTPLPGLHWNTDIPAEKSSDPKNIVVLSSIMLIVMLMACSNFISISLAVASNRRIEIGIRKVSGATRSRLALKFIAESIALSFISAAVGITIMVVCVPFFSSLIGYPLSIDLDATDVLFFISLVVAVGLLAGSYPAFVMASFKTAEILKGHKAFKLKQQLIAVLIGLQFIVSLFIATSSTTMSRQMSYMNTKPLGYNYDNVISIPTFADGTEAESVIGRFKAEASRYPEVESITATSSVFFGGLSRMGFVTDNGEKTSVRAYSVDPDFIKTLDIELVSGRDFASNSLADSNAVIINEKLAELMAEPVLERSFGWGMDKEARVIGVAKDFHYRNLEFPIEPLFITVNTSLIRPSVILVRIGSDDVISALATVEKVYKQANPNQPFEFKFLSDTVQNQYQSYKVWNNVITMANVFCAIIAAIGLFGLSSINTRNQFTEIAIRKVFGATVVDVLRRLLTRYVWLITIATIIGGTASYMVMSDWIQRFSYRIPISWSIFLTSFLVGLVIVVGSVGYQCISAAMSNPARTLRHEV